MMMEHDNEEYTRLFELSENITSITSVYMKNCSDKDGWVHYYAKTFRIKLPHLTFEESLPEFTVKLRKIIDLVHLSFYTVKVTNGKDYDLKDHNWYKTLETKIFSGLGSITEEQYEIIVLPFLKSNRFGQN